MDTQPRTVTVATQTTGANMRYNVGINPPDPTATSGTPIWASSGTVSVTPSTTGTTLKVIAFKSGMSDSIVHSATFTYEHDGPDAPPTSASYDFNGNLIAGLDGSTYTYDAQNRVTQATKNSVTMYFTYDGLNRQVSRRVGLNGTRTYSVWDGWDLVEEYRGAGTIVAAYLHGASGLVKNLVTNNYYYQDASGSTSHLANSGGALLEWYRYDLQGTPVFYNAADVQISGSNWDMRHLFTGQQWYSDLHLYDLRNRFYSPDIGRFLQPDPIGFGGDSTNLYRYCGNNPVTRNDPNGLWVGTQQYGNAESEATAERQVVRGTGFPTAQESWENHSAFGLRDPAISWGGGSSTGRVGGGYTQRKNITRKNNQALLPPLNAPLTDPPNPLVSLADLFGKIWTIPNTILGTIIGLASLPLGAHVDFAYNAIVFSNLPFGDRALTLGNTILTPSSFQDLQNPSDTYYASEYGDSAAIATNGFSETNSGWHEGAHTYQYEVLGPFFLPAYRLNHHSLLRAPSKMQLIVMVRELVIGGRANENHETDAKASDWRPACNHGVCFVKFHRILRVRTYKRDRTNPILNI